MAAYSAEDLQKLQRIELEMLRVVDKFCRQHGIVYFIDGGTCIGAVRHGGFIPWDDDIDLGMMRNDYERFVELFKKEPPDGYSIHTIDNTENYSYFFAKVYREGTRFLAQESIDAGLDSCIYLDVFVYDFVDPSLSDSKLGSYINKAMFWQRVMYLYHTSHPAVQPTVRFRQFKLFVSRIAHWAVRLFFTSEGIAKRYDKFIALINGDGAFGHSKRICCVQDFGFLNTEDVLPPVAVSFEGEDVFAPRNIDAYLSMMYGEYMQLPPEDKRKTHRPVVLDFGDLS